MSKAAAPQLLMSEFPNPHNGARQDARPALTA